jgi:hypothetical protein
VTELYDLLVLAEKEKVEYLEKLLKGKKDYFIKRDLFFVYYQFALQTLFSFYGKP